MGVRLLLACYGNLLSGLREHGGEASANRAGDLTRINEVTMPHYFALPSLAICR